MNTTADQLQILWKTKSYKILWKAKSQIWQ